MKKHLIFFLTFVGLVIFILSGTSFGARTFSQSEYNFVKFNVEGTDINLLYPEGWTIKKSDVTKGVVIATESKDGTFLFDVYRDKPIKEEDLDAYAKRQKEWLENKRENYKELSFEKNVTLHNYTGHLRKYTYTYKDNYYEAQEFYFKGKDGYFYIVLLDTPKGDLDDVLFDKLVEGLKIGAPTEVKQPEIKMIDFQSPDSDFMLKYPETWSLYSPKEDVVFSTTDKKGTFVEVLRHNIPKAMSTKEYALSSGKWLSEKLENYKETDFKPYEKDDLKGYMRSYNYTVNGKKHYALEYYFTYKLEDISKGFTLIFDMPEGFDSKYVETLRDIQKKILDSFSIIYG